jgi:lipopolysaccharide/colanic/teichoic acid biosynthesis glycosyltransferase
VTSRTQIVALEMSWAKRLFDITIAAVGLALVSPVLILIGIVLKLSSPGPVLYRGTRVGLGGELFSMLKFRTMVVNAESLGGSATAADDPRLTAFGKFLRRYKLDEFPQLVNVLVGNMSLVGPRPEVPKYVNLYSPEEKAILTVRPGITDWASIWNSNEAAVLEGSREPEKTYEELIRPTKLTLQLLYVRHHSLPIDLKILLYTALKLVHEDWVPKELKPYGRVRRYRMASPASV